MTILSGNHNCVDSLALHDIGEIYMSQALLLFLSIMLITQYLYLRLENQAIRV